MRVAGAVLVTGLLMAASGSVGCEDKPLVDRFLEAHGDGPDAEAASASAPQPGASSSSARSAASASASAARRQMPPRPVPLGSSGPIQPAAPEADQLMAIQYTIAMATPDSSDPPPDEGATLRILEKLKLAVKKANKGKTSEEPVMLNGKRVIELNMAHGCLAKSPENLVRGRAGLSLDELYQAGILVVMCHDDKWACHQATRVPEDVLCHAAPRHKH